jgi:hypothetical protein
MGPRIVIPKFTALGSDGDYSVSNCADIAFTVADTSDKNYFVSTGNELVIVKNINSGSTAHTFTVTSVEDEWKRTRNIAAYSIGAGETAVFGTMKQPGWAQTNGQIYCEGNHAEILIAVVQLP